MSLRDVLPKKIAAIPLVNVVPKKDFVPKIQIAARAQKAKGLVKRDRATPTFVVPIRVNVSLRRTNAALAFVPKSGVNGRIRLAQPLAAERLLKPLRDNVYKVIVT